MMLPMPEPPVIVRQATREDTPGIWAVRYSVTENTLTPGRISDDALQRSIDRDGRGWVAVDGQRILGFAIGLATGNVWALFVRPEAQGRSIGSALHAEMMAWFAQQPLQRLWLSTGVRTRARCFYERRGWHCLGPNGMDEVRLGRKNAG